MDGKIVNVTLVVRDKARALDFYTNQVGFEKKTDVTGPNGYRWVTVGPKGQELELALFELGSAVDPEQVEWSKHWVPGHAPPIQLQVADCRKTHAELSGKGVKFPHGPSDHPWGTVATFSDPDGNLFTISQLANWSKPK
jgi:predicted enzyme related to lactoylglutathione lyase